MPNQIIPLPLVPGQAGAPLHISPTDVSQFVRLEQCERYLRCRLSERAERKQRKKTFMEAYDVTPQRITPLLTKSGHEFEGAIEKEIKLPSIHFSTKTFDDAKRPPDNDQVIDAARKLAAGQTVVLCQPRLEIQIAGWLIRGDLDLLRLERRSDGTLHALITDMKASTKVKVEHRLQVAFYHLMLERLFKDQGVALGQIQTAIISHEHADDSAEAQQKRQEHQEAAERWFGLKDRFLDIVEEAHAYLKAAHDLVLGDHSVASTVVQKPFADIPFSLSFKCDGCLYNEFCMKWAAEHQDLSLLPYLSSIEKEALRAVKITKIEQLAKIKHFAAGARSGLVPAPGQEPLVKELSENWSIGPRLDELIHRAKKFCQSAGDKAMEAATAIPTGRISTLPTSTAELNPNLVRVYVEAQHDYLNDRVYMLGALVVANKDGKPERRRSIVHMTDGPPKREDQEQHLLKSWTEALLEAVVKLADGGEGKGKKAAPIHFIFFNHYEQRLLLQALARNLAALLDGLPALFDFLTQVEAFESPVATFLDEEIREFKNFPITCQSLQAVAAFLKFDWKSPHNFRDVFKARLFDASGTLDKDGTTTWYTRRSRFASSVPLEYAYAAWNELPVPEGTKPSKRAGKEPQPQDAFADYRKATVDLLQAFQVRRLEALEAVAGSVPVNRYGEKTPFVLPDLKDFGGVATDLAHALHEFVTIERLITLNDWLDIHHAPPERRVLMGKTLLVRYCEEDQEPGVADQVRENEVRRRKREEYKKAYKKAHPDAKQARLPKEQRKECELFEDLHVRLRLDAEGIDCGVNYALDSCNFREGEMLILYPRIGDNDRTPTANTLLHGPRVTVQQIVNTSTTGKGKTLPPHVEVELQEPFGGASNHFTFSSYHQPLEPGKLYTLDANPNDIYGFWCSLVVEGLCAGKPNMLYRRLTNPPGDADEAGLPGQRRFLKGLHAFHAARRLDHVPTSEQQKYIAGYGKTPLLLVQGPPGTGKSDATAKAIFARIQAAMDDDRDYRVFIGCKTHAATDVLMEQAKEMRRKLSDLSEADPALFQKHFDARLLDVPIYRASPRDELRSDLLALDKDDAKEHMAQIQQARWAIVATTPGGVHNIVKSSKDWFGQYVCDCLVLDEASQMNLPEALMTALPLKPEGQLIVVGDHRQMPPIVKNDWANELRRTFKAYPVFKSLFDSLHEQKPPPPMVQFDESFRVHGTIAEFLRQEIYKHDGIDYHSKRREVLTTTGKVADDFVAKVLLPDFPLVVIVHDEDGSQVRNPFEEQLIQPLIAALVDPKGLALNAEDDLGVVVPHRAQRAALQNTFNDLRASIDTIERFQGGERKVILISATESDRDYVLACSQFLLDPRRLTVALSRGKQKLILVASKTIFTLFTPDEQLFKYSLLWKNLLGTCDTKLWDGPIDHRRVTVWGASKDKNSPPALTAYVYSFLQDNALVGSVSYKDGDLVYTGDVDLMRDICNFPLGLGLPKEEIPAFLLDRRTTGQNLWYSDKPDE